MTNTNKPSLSQTASAIVSALIQSSPGALHQESTWAAAARPGETPDAARRRAVDAHDKAIHKSLGDTATAAWPTWLQVEFLTSLGKVESIGAAMDAYYKSERLHQGSGMRETLIRSRQQDFVKQGWVILASHHDAVNGRGLYVRKEAGALVLYASQL